MQEPLNARDLLDVVAKLSFARTLDGVAEVIRTCARRLVGSDGVTFVLRQGDCCYYADEDAIGPLWKGRSFPMDICISGWVMRHKEPALIPEIYADARIPHDAYRPTFVRSLVMVPVRREDPIAAIGGYWAEPGRPGDGELQVLQALADASALAVANVELYADLQRSLDSERAARQAADEAGRLKDEFLATLSHELRTPLHVMRGWLWQLRQPGADSGLNERALEIIERNAALQTRLVDDLLDVSGAMTGKLRLEVREVDLSEICNAAVGLVEPAARAKNITIRVSANGTPALVMGDPDRLQQMLWNVVSNAIKFSPAAGLVEIAARSRNGTVSVEVTDHGIGIEPEFLPYVFDAFRQAESGTTRRYGGLGLGLAIVRQLMQMHGGTVRAESAGRDQGTTVTLEFPALAAASLQEREPAAT